MLNNAELGYDSPPPRPPPTDYFPPDYFLLMMMFEHPNVGQLILKSVFDPPTVLRYPKLVYWCLSFICSATPTALILSYNSFTDEFCTFLVFLLSFLLACMPLCFPNPLGTVSCVCRVLYCQSASVIAAVTHHVYSVTFTFFSFQLDALRFR